ncbi:MAG: NupC/NupG family nucleoside CNT transporter [Bacteroidia bacterium]
MRAFIGIGAILFIAWLLSPRKAPPWRIILGGLALQVALAVFVLKVPWGHQAFALLSQVFVRVLDFTYEGSLFLFGNLVDKSQEKTFGYIFALRVLPTIIFFASLTAALYHVGVLQRVVQAFAWVVRKTLGTSGPESLCAASNIFLGQTEAPLLIRPFLSSMSRSEIFTVMVSGMATLAGGVLAAYVGFLGGNDPLLQKHFAHHLLTASIINVPAALVISKLLVPPVDPPVTRTSLTIAQEKQAANVLEALSMGALEGLRLAANVAAMLLAFIALLALLNYVLAHLGLLLGLSAQALRLEAILGYVLRPLAYLLGISWEESFYVGSILGQKVVLNEFIGYISLAQYKAQLSMQAQVVTTYALSGFANFSSIAIQLGGIGSLAPEKRPLLAQLGLRAVLGGTLANLLSACWAGVLIEL